MKNLKKLKQIITIMIVIAIAMPILPARYKSDNMEQEIETTIIVEDITPEEETPTPTEKVEKPVATEKPEETVKPTAKPVETAKPTPEPEKEDKKDEKEEVKEEKDKKRETEDEEEANEEEAVSIIEQTAEKAFEAINTLANEIVNLFSTPLQLMLVTKGPNSMTLKATGGEEGHKYEFTIYQGAYMGTGMIVPSDTPIRRFALPASNTGYNFRVEELDEFGVSLSPQRIAWYEDDGTLADGAVTPQDPFSVTTESTYNEATGEINIDATFVGGSGTGGYMYVLTTQYTGVLPVPSDANEMLDEYDLTYTTANTVSFENLAPLAAGKKYAVLAFKMESIINAQAGTYYDVSSVGVSEVAQGDLTISHNWGPWVTTTPATCTTTGVKTRTCQTCVGVTDTDTIPAKGHEWSEEYTIDTPATCTVAGSKSKHCLNDDNHHTDVTPIPAEGHTWGAWVTIQEPTGTEEGIKKRVCAECQAFETGSVPMLVIDSDGDGFTDAEEIEAGSDPNDPRSTPTHPKGIIDILVDDKEVEVGEEIVYTWTYVLGLKSTDDESVITGIPTYKVDGEAITIATKTGVSTITMMGLEAEGYAIEYIEGTLIVYDDTDLDVGAPKTVDDVAIVFITSFITLCAMGYILSTRKKKQVN